MRWKRKEKTQPAKTAPMPTLKLYLPQRVLQETHDYFFPYWRVHVETACFWFGIQTGECQIITTLAIPKLYQTSGNYLVEKESIRRLASAMRLQGLTNLAQVHTHPTDWVEHSVYDSEHAYSTKDGALSFVWPNYGASAAHSLAGIGVHERRNQKWIQLTEDQMDKRIFLVDSVADFRWQINGGGIRNEEYI